MPLIWGSFWMSHYPLLQLIVVVALVTGPCSVSGLSAVSRGPRASVLRLSRLKAPPALEDKAVAVAVSTPLPAVPSLLPSISLIAGNAVGAGVLALPSVSVPLGAGPSTMALLVTWAACLGTGLLTAEAILNGDPADPSPPTHDSPASVQKLTTRLLGAEAGALSCGGLLLLNTALLVAYTSKTGEALSGLLSPVLPAGAASPAALMTAYTFVLAGVVQAGPSRVLDQTQGVLVGVLVACFGALLAALLPGVDPALLAHGDWDTLPEALPVLVCALVFHNVVPSVVAQQDGDPDRVRAAITAGTSIPAAMYLLFNLAFLGHIAADDSMTSALVHDQISAAISADPVTSAVFPIFTVAAITTSSIGTALGQFEELKSVLRGATGSSENSAGLALTVLFLPPLCLAVACSNIFEAALEFGGTYGDVLLFGLLPVAMVWEQRRRWSGANDRSAVPPTRAPVELVPGGNVALGSLVAASLSVVGLYSSHLMSLT